MASGFVIVSFALSPVTPMSDFICAMIVAVAAGGIVFVLLYDHFREETAWQRSVKAASEVRAEDGGK